MSALLSFVLAMKTCINIHKLEKSRLTCRWDYTFLWKEWLWGRKSHASPQNEHEVFARLEVYIFTSRRLSTA